ncbi:CDP-diacylglycerol--glycerol-3-phosphate 3-phosphatidyltransferase [Saccharomonospora iraqiensis]|uniref:CDP-diacylglycerol--glycerol-3-phosphate 3-phosphatidyltransferase n=1 Tax=Saccharomonospora iraqiensis TaxID=52698 RepID=UPI00022E1C83|nr:CDP-diacylglycerol--glycerol-3-phosphate 3-phosphatidyltransferase [Saccharomonospora iraqiensis]
MNLANVLTVVRLALVPLFVVVLFVEEGEDPLWRYLAVAVFVAAALTDRIDGWVARRYGLVTDFGKVADPIADKALIGAALVGLSVLGELPWWITAVIAARELGVTALRFWVIRHGVIPASRGGKAKTLAQVVAIAAFLLPLPDVLDPVRWALMALAVLLTVVTGLDYLVQALRMRAGGDGRSGGARTDGRDTGADPWGPGPGRTGPATE